MVDETRSDSARPYPVAPTEKLSAAELDMVQASLHGTGFLLEQRVYETFVARGFNAFLGAVWTDGDTGKGREIDVMVRGHTQLPSSGMTVWTSVVAECKAWRQPLVVIGRSGSSFRRARVFSEAHMGNDPLLSDLSDEDDHSSPSSLGNTPTFLGLRRLPSSVESAGFLGTQIVRLDRIKSGFRAANDSVYESVLQPLAKATQVEQMALADDGGFGRFPTLVLSFPVVVTSGPVVEAELRGDGVEVRQVDRTRVFRQFSSPHQAPSLIVEIVHEAALGSWLTDRVSAFTDDVTARVESIGEVLVDSERRRDETELRRLARQWAPES